MEIHAPVLKRPPTDKMRTSALEDSLKFCQ